MPPILNQSNRPNPTILCSHLQKQEKEWIKFSQIPVNNSRSSVWIILIFRKVYRFLSQNIRQRYFMEKYNRHKVCDTLLITNKKLPLCSKYFVTQNTEWQSGCKYPIVQYISLTSRETGNKKNIFFLKILIWLKDDAEWHSIEKTNFQAVNFTPRIFSHFNVSAAVLRRNHKQEK